MEDDMGARRNLTVAGFALIIFGQARIADAITVPDLSSACSTSNGASGCFKITNNHTSAPYSINAVAAGSTNGVTATAASGTGVSGTSTSGTGVNGSTSGASATGINGSTSGTNNDAKGVKGTSVNGFGVYGTATGNGTTATGVYGQANGTGDAAIGVQGVAAGSGAHTKGVSGISANGYGVYAAQTGTSGTPGLTGPAGLYATSASGHGVLAVTTKESSVAAAVYGYTSTFGAFGVIGHQAGNDSGTGVEGLVTDAAGNLVSNGFAVRGLGGGISVYGQNDVGGTGVFGHSNSNNGVMGQSYATTGSVAGVAGTIETTADGSCAAIYGDSFASWTAWAGNYNGDVQARGFYNSSDVRLKKDIKDATYGLPELMKLRPVTYKWKKGADHAAQNGLIAQEVQKIFPSSVRGNGKSEMLAVDYVSLLPVAIKSIQQQQAIIQRQESRIAELERRSAPLASSLLPGNIGAWAAFGLLPIGMLIERSRRRRRGDSKSA
jgi:hypothetical protein